MTHNQTAQKALLLFGIVFYGLVALITAGPGAGMRSLGAALQPNPWIHLQSKAPPKTPTDHFTHLCWNICCIGGGYPISDGGVTPWASRIEALAAKILETDADVNNLYELFDLAAAGHLYRRLSGVYKYFYFGIGARGTGISSGLMVVSKFPIQNPIFTPFPKETLVGRTKKAEKGVFEYDIVASGRPPIAHIFTTHLQHSEEPAFPTEEEVAGRRAQMALIVAKVEAIKDRCVIVSGDLNLDPSEHGASSWKGRFATPYTEQSTWGGDAFCARLVGGKRLSRPLTLDYTLVSNNGFELSASTSLVRTGFDAERLTKGALSDHEGVLTRFELKSKEA